MTNKILLLIGLSLLLLTAFTSAETINTACSDVLCITERTEYGVLENNVYIEISDLEGKQDALNLRVIYNDGLLTRQIKHSSILIEDSYEVDIYGPVNVSIGKCKIINESTTGETPSTQCWVDDVRLYCNSIAADKSCYVIQEQLIGTKTKYHYVPLTGLTESKLILDGKVKFTDGQIPLSKHGTTKLLLKVQTPLKFGISVPKIENKYDIEAWGTSDHTCLGDMNCVNGITELDPTWWYSSATSRWELNNMTINVTLPINGTDTFIGEQIYASNCSTDNLTVYGSLPSDIMSVVTGANVTCNWFSTSNLTESGGTPPSNLFIHYPLDNSEAVAIDFSANEYNATLNNTPVQSVAGKIFNSYNFSFSDGDYLDSGIFQTIRNGSAMAWVRMDTVTDGTNNRMIIGNGNGGGNFDIFVYKAGHVYGRTRMGLDYTISTSFDLPTKEWHHLAYTWTTEGAGLDNLTLYYDGIKTNSTEAVIGECEVAQGDILISKRTKTSTQYFDGQIDDVRVYTTQLTPDEVYSIYALSASADAREDAPSDTTPPSLDWNWTAINTSVSSSDVYNVCINASEAVNCSLNFGGTVWVNGTSSTDICFFNTTIADNNYTVFAECSDTSANSANTTDAWYTIDTTGPIIVWNWTSINTTTHNNTINIGWNLSEDGNCSIEFNGTWYNLPSYCDQETANVSTLCDGLSTGSYNHTINTSRYHGELEINYTKPSYATNDSLWTVKIGDLSKTNLSIGDCWDAYSTKVRLKLISDNADGGGGSAVYSSANCYNGTNWVELLRADGNLPGTYSNADLEAKLYDGNWNTYTCWYETQWANDCGGGMNVTRLYEEAMVWTPVIGKFRNITFYDLPDGNYSTINVTCEDELENTATSTNAWVNISNSSIGPTTYPTVDWNWTDINSTSSATSVYNVCINASEAVNCSLNFGGTVWVNGTSSTDICFFNTTIADNNYTVFAECSDTSANSANTTDAWYTIDTVAPTITLVFPANNTNTTNTTIKFQYSITEGETWVENTSLYINGTVNNASCTTTECMMYLEAGKNYSSINWYIRAMDNASNTGESLSRNLTIDNTAPTISWGAWTGKNTTIAVNDTSVTWTTSEPTQNCTMYINYSQTFYHNTTSGSSYSYNLTNIPNGNYTLNVTCRDYADNKGTSSIAWVNISVPDVDSVPPSLDWNWTAINTSVSSSDVYNVCINASEAVNCSLNFGGTVWVNGTSSTDICFFNTTIADNNYTVFAECSDTSANSANTTDAWYTIDTVAPTITLVFPANNTNTTNTTIKFQYTISETTTWVENTSLYINGTVNNASCTTTECMMYLEAGKNYSSINWYIRAMDNASNTGTSLTRNLTIDNTAPTISWGAWTGKNTTITVNDTSVTWTTSEPTQNCTMYINYSQTFYHNTTSGSSYSYNLTNISNGNYTLNVTCRDYADNKGTSTNSWVNLEYPSTFTASEWGRKSPITFIKPDSNLTNFPALINNLVLPQEMWNTTYGTPYLAKSNGCDIRFTKDVLGTVELPFELVNWTQDSVTGSEIWVKTNISSVMNTTIWVWYNYTAVSCYASNDTYGAENVWNDYVAVYHLNEVVNNDAGGYDDSTSNEYDGTGTSMALSGVGQIGDGQQFDGSTDYITLPSGVLTNSGTKGTMCAWVKPDQPSSDTNPLGITATRNSDTIYFSFFEASGRLQISYTNGGGASVWWGADILDSATDWRYYCLVSDDSEWFSYINSDVYNLSAVLGLNDGDWYAAAVGAGTTPKIGFHDTATYNFFFDGNMDEVRLSLLNRSQDWINAEYLNQFSITQFATNDYSVSVDETTNSMKDLRVIAMNGSEVGDLLFNGYSSITPDNIEVRVIRTDTNATVQINGEDWTNLTTFQIDSEGFWNGTLNLIPKTNSWLNFELRVSNNTGYNYTTSNRIGVGYVVLYTGQSYMDFWLDWTPNITPHEVPSELTSKFRDKKTGQADGNAPTYTGWTENTGSGSITFANKLQEALECPIGVLDYGMAGSALIEANKIPPYGYWIGSHATDNWLDDVYEGVLISEPTARRKLNAVLWYQGYTDGYAGVTYNDFYNNLGLLFSNFTNLSNNDNLQIYLVGQPRSELPDTPADAGFNNMRLATIDQAENNLTDNIYFAGQTVDFPLYDSVHLTNESQVNESLRYAQSVLYNELGTGDFTYSGIGPRVLGYFIVNSTTTAVRIQHEGGTDFTPSTNIDSFQVQNTTNWYWVNGTRHDSTTVYLNTSGITVTNLRILYGRNPPISGILKDNSSLQLPILIEDVVFLIDGLPPTYSLNQTNNTYAGKSTLFSIYVNDDTLLQPNGQYIFSTNNTGNWNNDSAINFTTTPQWANVTKTLNSTVGIKIGYRWYITDNASNLASTPIYNLTTLSPDTTPPSLDWNWTAINTSISSSDVYNVCINASEAVNCSLNFGGTVWVNGTSSTDICFFNTTIADNNYTVFAECSDTSANSANTTDAWYTIDTVAPTITLVFPANNTNTSNQTIKFQYSITEGETWVENISLYNNGTVRNASCDATECMAYYTGDYSSINWYIRAMDNASNTGTSLTRNLTIDTTAPQIDWNWTNINTSTNSNLVQNICINASEAVNCSMTFNGTYVQNATSATNICFYRSGLGDGNYSTINVTCDDAGANSGNVTNAWTYIDNTAPTLIWNWTDINSTITTTNITKICVNSTEIINCTLNLNGTSYQNTTSSTTVCWTRELSNGNYSTINATCEDTLTNPTTTSNAWINVSAPSDSTPPVINWTWNYNVNTTSNRTNLNITIEADENLASCIIQLGSDNYTMTSDTATTYHYDWNITTEANYTIEVRCNDTALNEGNNTGEWYRYANLTGSPDIIFTVPATANVETNFAVTNTITTNGLLINYTSNISDNCIYISGDANYTNTTYGGTALITTANFQCHTAGTYPFTLNITYTNNSGTFVENATGSILIVVPTGPGGGGGTGTELPIEFTLIPNLLTPDNDILIETKAKLNVNVENTGRAFDGVIQFEKLKTSELGDNEFATDGWCYVKDSTYDTYLYRQDETVTGISIYCDIPDIDKSKEQTWVEKLCMIPDGDSLSQKCALIKMSFVPLSISVESTRGILEQYWWIFLLIIGFLIFIILFSRKKKKKKPNASK